MKSRSLCRHRRLRVSFGQGAREGAQPVGGLLRRGKLQFQLFGLCVAARRYADEDHRCGAGLACCAAYQVHGALQPAALLVLEEAEHRVGVKCGKAPVEYIRELALTS